MLLCNLNMANINIIKFVKIIAKINKINYTKNRKTVPNFFGQKMNGCSFKEKGEGGISRELQH